MKKSTSLLVSIIMFFAGFLICTEELSKLGASSMNIDAIHFARFLMLGGGITFIISFFIDIPQNEKPTIINIWIPITIIVSAFLLIYVPIFLNHNTSSKNRKEQIAIIEGKIDLKTLISSDKKLTQNQIQAIGHILDKKRELHYDILKRLSDLDMDENTLLKLYYHPFSTKALRSRIFDKLAEKDYVFYHSRLPKPAQHPELLPEEIHNISVIHGDKLRVLEDVLQNPRCPEKTITYIVDKYSKDLLEASHRGSRRQAIFAFINGLISSHPNTSIAIIDKLISNSIEKMKESSYNRDFVFALSNNSNLTEGQSTKILNALMNKTWPGGEDYRITENLLKYNRFSNREEMNLYNFAVENKYLRTISLMAQYAQHKEIHTKILNLLMNQTWPGDEQCHIIENLLKYKHLNYLDQTNLYKYATENEYICTICRLARYTRYKDIHAKIGKFAKELERRKRWAVEECREENKSI